MKLDERAIEDTHYDQYKKITDLGSSLAINEIKTDIINLFITLYLYTNYPGSNKL